MRHFLFFFVPFSGQSGQAGEGGAEPERAAGDQPARPEAGPELQGLQSGQESGREEERQERKVLQEIIGQDQTGPAPPPQKGREGSGEMRKFKEY